MTAECVLVEKSESIAIPTAPVRPSRRTPREARHVQFKLWSRNDSKSDYAGWQKYLNNTDAFADSDQTKSSGLYELARNWRIVSDMARDRPMALVNLGPGNLFTGKHAGSLETFTKSLRLNAKRQFLTVGWDSLWSALPDHPDWLHRSVKARRVPVLGPAF